MRVACFIPARMASSRFPGKPLTPIAGEPMLEHCYRGASQSGKLDEVVIATCDEEIAAWASSRGIASVMTSDRHERATDRVAEATASVEADVVVLVQGDEPLVNGEMVDAALEPVLRGDSQCTNLIKRIDTMEELVSRHTVKVAVSPDWRAMYFSRSAIPSPALAGFEHVTAFKQVAVFGFTREMLLEFSALEPTPLEIAESVDMLRYLEHGRRIDTVETTRDTHGVAVEADVAVVEAMMGVRGALGSEST